jgi:hypothetical protein
MSLSIEERCRINHLSSSIIALSQVVIEVFIDYLFHIIGVDNPDNEFLLK